MGPILDGEELIITIKLTKNAEENLSEIQRLLCNGEEIIPGVLITTIFARGRSIQQIQKFLSKEILQTLLKGLEENE